MLNIMLKHRFRETRLAAGLTQRLLAERANTDQPAISNIEKGLILRPRNIETLAKLLNVTPQWLLFGSDNQASEPSNYYNIPVMANYDDNASNTTTSSLKPISKQWIIDKGLIADDLVVVKINNDSMAPRICKDDLLIANTSKKKFVSGKVYAIDVKGHIHIKRMHRSLSGDWIMASDNTSYPSEATTIQQLAEINTIGEVISIMMGSI